MLSAFWHVRGAGWGAKGGGKLVAIWLGSGNTKMVFRVV